MTIKINFCDFWPGFKDNNLFLKFFEKYFDISIVENPDFLIFSVYGNTHLKYKDSIKIFFTGENIVPDFNLCDYAIGYHYLEFGDRYMRFPLYVYYQWYYSYLGYGIDQGNKVNMVKEEGLLRRKFCNFLYSNRVHADPIRDRFFNEISKYKRVDSGGRHLNNVGKPVNNKMHFIKDYKFTIAFENSCVPGYTTEKLLEPILINSLPIYYGNPLVHLDFNINSFIRVKNTHDIDRAIDEIIFLDQNDDSYLERQNQPKFVNDNSLEMWEEKLLVFFNNIFKQGLLSAKRKPEYGFSRYYCENLGLKASLLDKHRSWNSIKAGVKHLIMGKND